MTNFHSSSVRSRARLLASALLLAGASLPALAMQPFTANYSANYMGLDAVGTMTMAPAGGDRWSYTLNIRSSLAQLTQRTVFEDHDGKWRPLSNDDSASVLIKKKHKTADYDWGSGVARWSGDVKPDRSGPVKLQPGDLDAMLVNLAIARDVAAGKPLSYRMVDDGRAKSLTYQVAGKDTVTVAGKSHAATKVSRTDGNKQTIVWVVEGMPVPARILQRKDGKDEMDLRLKSID